MKRIMAVVVVGLLSVAGCSSYVNGYKIEPGANLGLAFLATADLTGANLEGANLQQADLTGANLEGANLQQADLAHAYL